jgi:hypothetical protein
VSSTLLCLPLGLRISDVVGEISMIAIFLVDPAMTQARFEPRSGVDSLAKPFRFQFASVKKCDF